MSIKNMILGNTALQPLYKALFKIGVKGMNYDRGQVVEKSGEGDILTYVTSKLNRSATIFDVGANKGQYAMMVLKKAKPPFQLYSFEPQKSAFANLKNITAVPHFKPFNIGLGSEKKQETLYNQIEGSGFASVVATSHDHVAEELVRKETIDLSTIDIFCEEQGIKTIDLLKIDVEGYEIEVLKGAKTMIANGNIPYIQFEFGIASIEARIFMKDFFKILPGYTIHRVLPHGLVKLEHYSEYLELFLTTNYLAVRNAQ
jgi:FkbM family methyltransferase